MLANTFSVTDVSTSVIDDIPFEETVFCESLSERQVIREFSETTDKDDLIWHRDRECRILTVIQSDGWQFQSDNELPIDLSRGDVIYIEPAMWHRVIKGKGSLILHLQIQKSK